jgi:hypothetical protein
VYDPASVLVASPPNPRTTSIASGVDVRSALPVVATVLVLTIGIGLRLWRPDLAQTNFDESNVGSLVAAWKYQGAFPLAGTVSSYGFRAGPAWPWFAALGLQWTDDPYALLATGLAAGVGGLIACWWVARRWLGMWGGVAAAAMHGTMFWCVVLERGVWQPVFLQAPMALCLDALLRLGVQRRPWALVMAAGWLGVLVSVHYTAAAFGLVVLVAMWLARDVLRPHHVAAALIVGALPLAPFFAYEVNPAVRLQDVSDLLSLSRGSSVFDFETISSTIQISSTLGAAGLGGHAGADIAAELGRWNNLSLLGPILAAAGLVVGVVSRPRGRIGLLIAAWTLAPIVAYLRHSAPIIFHYMFIEFTGLAMAVGVLGAWAAGTRWTWLRASVAAAIGVSTAASALSVLVLLHGLDEFDFSAGYGVPLGYSREAGAVAREAVGPGGVVLIGDDPHYGEVLRFTLGYGIDSRTFEDCREVPYAPGAVYLLSSENTPGWRALEQAGAPLLARLPRPGGDAYRIYGTLPSPPPSGSLSVARPAPDNAICADRTAWDGPDD